MRNKIYDEIKIFELNVFREKCDCGDIIEYKLGYDTNTYLCPGIIEDSVAINLLSWQIYPICYELNDFVMLNTLYVTHVYNYGERIENDTGYYVLNLEVNEAKELYNKAKKMIENIKLMREKNIIWFEKERAKILQNRLDR